MFGLPTAASSLKVSAFGDEATGETAFFLALAWARRIPNGPRQVSASPARVGVSFAFRLQSFYLGNSDLVVPSDFKCQLVCSQGSRGSGQALKPGGRLGLAVGMN